jgi:hypothetical protein
MVSIEVKISEVKISASVGELSIDFGGVISFLMTRISKKGTVLSDSIPR